MTPTWGKKGSKAITIRRQKEDREEVGGITAIKGGKRHKKSVRKVEAFYVRVLFADSSLFPSIYVHGRVSRLCPHGLEEGRAALMAKETVRKTDGGSKNRELLCPTRQVKRRTCLVGLNLVRFQITVVVVLSRRGPGELELLLVGHGLVQ